MGVKLNASQLRALAILHSVSTGGKGDSIPGRVVQQLMSLGLVDYQQGEHSRFLAITEAGRAVHESTVPCSHCGGDTFEHCLATPSCTGPQPNVLEPER